MTDRAPVAKVLPLTLDELEAMSEEELERLDLTYEEYKKIKASHFRILGIDYDAEFKRIYCHQKE